jgi:large subunit ribosomal protein L24
MARQKAPKYQGNRTSFKMHVHTDDLVQVISGASKGQTGKVLQVFPKESTIIVEGVNVKTKHIKPAREGEQGQTITKEFPIHSSKVMIYSEKQKVASRVGYTTTEAGIKVRVLKKTGEILEPKTKKKTDA